MITNEASIGANAIRTSSAGARATPTTATPRRKTATITRITKSRNRRLWLSSMPDSQSLQVGICLSLVRWGKVCLSRQRLGPLRELSPRMMPRPGAREYLYARKNLIISEGFRRGAGRGDGERETDCFADRPERRVDHPQGHHAEDPGNPTAESQSRRVFRWGRVRGLLASAGQSPADRGSGRGQEESLRTEPFWPEPVLRRPWPCESRRRRN